MNRSSTAAFVVLLLGTTVMWTTLSVAQEAFHPGEEAYPKLANFGRVGVLSRAGIGDTLWVGHCENTPNGGPPYFVGASDQHDPNFLHQGVWDWDVFNGGVCDSLQGWIPAVRPNVRTCGTISDIDRSWQCLDWGNRLNQAPFQGRTPGTISAWHVDRGALVPNPATASASPTWGPIAGSGSAWCGLRADDDPSYFDQVMRGGTGNPFSGAALTPDVYNRTTPTSRNFPGYANRWDQMLYRDVRVAAGSTFSLSFQYVTAMSTDLDKTATSGTGWFDKDPLSLAAGNLISNSNTPGRSQPVDSFMVYVGCPADPQACQYTDGEDPRPIYDLKRRWLSEVIAIDKPYFELLSVAGDHAEAFLATLTNPQLAQLLDAQGAPDGGGILRVVFRSKTNRDFSDETCTAGVYNSGTEGAVRIDEVTIQGNTTITSGFEAVEEITNWIEPADNGTPGPEVGEGYALMYWHSTGKPPKAYFHPHPIYGGYIDEAYTNYYPPLRWEDPCGLPDPWYDMSGVVVSSGDHDRDEAAGGPMGTPFKENVQWLISPTINLVVPEAPLEKNNQGLDRVHVYAPEEWILLYDVYAGVFNMCGEHGNVWYTAMMSWPAVQANGAKVWSDVVIPTTVNYWPEPNALRTFDKPRMLMRTSNENGMPDSIRVILAREQRCLEFGVTVGCSPTDGHYIDNVSLGFPFLYDMTHLWDAMAQDFWDWYQDAFPANETAGLPGVAAAFDTMAAMIKTGLNTAAYTCDMDRVDVPGDSMVTRCTKWDPGDGKRVDCVFRVFPGPGNYVIAGNRAAGLRKVPSAPAAATPGDGSFFGQYMAAPGPFSGGDHAGGWNPNTWNSVRCDTLEINLFPCDGRTVNLSNLTPDWWMSTIHEADPNYDILGILKNICFLIDPSLSAPLDHTNITCAMVPLWANGQAGFNGNQATREFTKVFPDGQFVPGTHIEYFMRYSRLATPATFAMMPDTNRILPQPAMDWYDPIRWQSLAVSPDRWKDAVYGGTGAAYMLVVDADDRRGDEEVWVSTADTLGATLPAKWGAHNGWHADINYISAFWGASANPHNYWYDEGIGGDPTISVWSHGGQPGTTWDFYQIKASESVATNSGSIGSRLANRPVAPDLRVGMESRQGPTPEMLRAYYRLLFFMSGDIEAGILGPYLNKSQDDIAILEDFLSYNASYENPRGAWFQGNGFVGDVNPSPFLEVFLINYPAVSLRSRSYYELAGTADPCVDLLPTGVIQQWPEEKYGVHNSCLIGNDVYEAGYPGTAALWYENLGAIGPFIGGVYKPSVPQSPWVSLVAGQDLYDILSTGCGNTVGRLLYVCHVLQNTFGSVAPFVCTTTMDVPQNTVRVVDFLDNIRGNPMTPGGKVTVYFTLAKSDRVQVKVYDVVGRLVRTLADRDFEGGQEYSLVWDGRDDAGRAVARGVYFTQVRFVRSGFLGNRKLTVLK